MPGLVPGIHVFPFAAKTWMAGTSPAMTEEEQLGWHPVHRADLVAVEIAQISQIEFTRAALANARRVFASRAAIGEPRRVPRVGLFGRACRKADGAAIGVCCRLAVDWFRHRKHAGLGEVE